MNDDWHPSLVPLKFQLGDMTLCAPSIAMQVFQVGLTNTYAATAVPLPPSRHLEANCDGFLIRSLPITGKQRRLRWDKPYLCYVPAQYKRYYIDLGQSFTEYSRKFSSKTRSTIKRKIKKFDAHCAGRVHWKVYKTSNDIEEFHQFARRISVASYQENLLGAGLPDSDEFCCNMKSLAEEGRVRAYILFHDERPVAYLYCPIMEGVLLYQYVGYDALYRDWSVGTILQWHALEDIFNDGTFRVFDFTEGEADHKRQFATHCIDCANVYFLRCSFRNIALVLAHRAVDDLSKAIGGGLEWLGLKARIKRLIRFGL